MDGFLFSFLAAVLAGIGARDQALVAAFSARRGTSMVLAIGIVTAALASAGAGWAATALADGLVPAARTILTGFALMAAGIASLVRKPRRPPDEPTRSLGAAALVLLSEQITDATRFLVLALALVTNAPGPAALGGALGSAASLTFGWVAGAVIVRPGAVLARRLIGAALAVLGLFLFVGALPR